MSSDEFEPVDGTQEDAQLARVLERYLADREEGRAPNAEELIAAHPEIGDRLRDCLKSLKFVEHSGCQDKDAASSVETSHEEGVLGDYRILGEIGRGGMGVVYEAVQISLRRHVALKVLPFAAMLDPRQLRRFKTEAEAAASLHHPNIVPVYGIGCERGVYYYAMQLVEGRALDAVIKELQQWEDGEPSEDRSESVVASHLLSVGLAESGELAEGSLAPTIAAAGKAQAIREHSSGFDVSTATTPVSPSCISSERSTRTLAYCRSIAQLGVQAAEALDHAHEVGVIHRDIKPSNLMLDSQGKLWVTDFGLARIEKDPGLTMTGDVIGTLRYMSPEQALAKRVVVDSRTDVYSLGVTLYELL